MTMPQTKLVGRPVGQMGFGLMQLTWAPELPSQETSFAAMKAAADAGCTAWSTAMFYGNFLDGHPEKMLDNIRLIASFFEKYPEYKDKITLVIKGGITPEFQMTIDLDFWRKQLEETRQILGVKTLDVVSSARIPVGKTAEDVVKAMITLRDEGYFTHIGASEINVDSIKAMEKFAPVAVVEIELSLWSFEPAIQQAVDYCAKNQIPIFAYSPLGRGFISRKWKTPEDIPEGAFQRTIPRFQGESFYENLKLVDQLDELAAKKGVKTTQLALAWIVGLSPYNIPIPGSSNPGRVGENAEAASIKLSEDDLKGINDTLAKFEVKGDRYKEHGETVLMR